MPETICPFCKTENNCMAHRHESCWCNDVHVPPALLDLVPAAEKRKACICLSCIRSYNEDPHGFVARIKSSSS